ncbi:MAG: hypothetical protein CTY31_10065 [Hyphomicrobium sp.]|nr:MAG: hypothetical protein CTY39_05375 [Hyphomicrobium sp.]PPC99309.1 MAG: hypothetical protein CTY31_10065 [Hyphomicrobium sp.]
MRCPVTIQNLACGKFVVSSISLVSQDRIHAYGRYFGTIGVLGISCVALASSIANSTLPEILAAYKTESTALSRVEKNALWKFTAAAKRMPRNLRVHAIKVPQQPLHVLVSNMDRAEQRQFAHENYVAKTATTNSPGSAVLAASCEIPDQYVYCVIPNGTAGNADVLRLPASSSVRNKSSRATALVRRPRKTKPVIVAEVTADIIMRNIKGPS